MAKTKYILWLSSHPSLPSHAKAQNLKKQGLKITFVKDLPTLFLESNKERSSFIFISDNEEDSSVIDAIRKITQNPDTKSAKFILICERFSSKLQLMAASHAFRGILSCDLADELWHFVLSTNPSTALPIGGKVSLNYICKIMVPARLIWISHTLIRIEGSVRLQVGDRLSLIGALSELVDRNQLELTVTSVHQTKLLYRFSYAYECDLTSTFNTQEILDLFNKIKPYLSTSPVRIFAIVKNPRLRHLMAHAFSENNWDLTMALHLKSMLTEPSYLTPDIVFIEETFATSPSSQNRFQLMLESLSKQTTVVIIKKSKSSIPSHFGGREIKTLNEDEASFSAETLRRICPQPQSSSSEYYFSRSHSISYAHFTMTGHLHSLHPLYAQITTPQAIVQYALCQIDTPLIRQIYGQPAWLKIASCSTNFSISKDPNSQFILDGILSASNDHHRQLIADYLTQAVAKHLAKFLHSPQANEQESPSSNAAISEAPSSILQDSSLAKFEDKSEQLPYIREKSATGGKVDDSLRYTLMIIFLTIIISGLLAYLLPKLASNIEKSGKVYSEQLQIFKNQR